MSNTVSVLSFLPLGSPAQRWFTGAMLLLGACSHPQNSDRAELAVWNLRDGIQLTVHRGWPDTTTFLEYTNPPKLAAGEREITAERQQQQAARGRVQNAAF